MKRSPMPRRKKPMRTGAPLKRAAFGRGQVQPRNAPERLTVSETYEAVPPPVAGRKRMKQVSDKRRSQADERAAVVALVRARDRSCRGATLMPDRPCGGPLDVHERIQRSLWAAGYLDPDNCVLLCRNHHVYAHENVEEAHRVGLLRHGWERPL